MPETREFAVKLDLVDAVSPILRSIEALAPLCGSPIIAMPNDPARVVTMPGSTTAVLVPSEQLLGFLFGVAQDARQNASDAADRVAFAKLTLAERQNRAAAN